MSKLKLVITVTITLLLFAPAVEAERSVQQSWTCQVGSVKVVSNTPCQNGAQPVSSATSVIYHCQRDGVATFQQSPCAARDATVQLYRDNRTPATIASGLQVRATTLAMANTARASQLARETGRALVVVGKTESTGRTGGDGKADGYRTPNRSTRRGGSR